MNCTIDVLRRSIRGLHDFTPVVEDQIGTNWLTSKMASRYGLHPTKEFSKTADVWCEKLNCVLRDGIRRGQSQQQVDSQL